MCLLKEAKAVSTLLLILLMLCSAVFGAFIAYMWVMATFYLEPENTVDLVITEVNFPIDHADFFNLTVMNPSHSPSGTSITEIYFTVEGDDSTYNVTHTFPEELPIPLERASSKAIKCRSEPYWGEFAGKTITVHVFAVNASGAVRSAETEFVKLEVETCFNAAESCKRFNVTVKNNEQSAINLNLTEVYFDYEPVENMSVGLPRRISKGETLTFQCFVDWRGHAKPLIQVETLEGYRAEIRQNVSSVVILSVTDVIFNETDSNEISITFFNSVESATLVDITDIVLTYDNGTEYPVPPFDPPYRVAKNQTLTINCVWNWANYRDRNVTITAYTKQGFTSLPETVKTPQSVIFRITELDFNLTKTECFLVTVRNMPCSLQSINITQIMFNENGTSFESRIIPIRDLWQFNCTWNWTSFRGQNVTITVYTEDGLSISQSSTLPSVELKRNTCDFEDSGESATGTRYYLNLTVSNSEFSSINVTIIQIMVETENMTYTIDGTITNPIIDPDGYILIKGANVTIYCPWNWSLHGGQTVTITVYTAEGFQKSDTFQVPETAP